MLYFHDRGHVTALILKLALHSEVCLQTLAFRLDYSDFYKRGDAKLHEPLTYQHKRLSEIGLSLAKVYEQKCIYCDCDIAYDKRKYVKVMNHFK